MRKSIAAAAPVAALLAVACSGSGESPGEPAPVLVVHGGAGTIVREAMSPELEAQYRSALEESLRQGMSVLDRGGSSLDAVELAVSLLEDSPLFNAGRGSVFTAEGRVEMDAAIMDGSTLQAGAVAAVTRVKNPIRAARLVMETTPHILLSGSGAESLAATAGLELEEPSYFFTERRWRQLLERRSSESADSATAEAAGGLGTVGAVALDLQGRLAAATSTGGLTNKLSGRIGDTPIVGAGTYAGPECAVSGTGHGESFMRHVTAYALCARRGLPGSSLSQAAEELIHQVMPTTGGTGGVIALDRSGEVAMTFNTEGMYRGLIRSGDEPLVELYR